MRMLSGSTGHVGGIVGGMLPTWGIWLQYNSRKIAVDVCTAPPQGGTAVLQVIVVQTANMQALEGSD